MKQDVPLHEKHIQWLNLQKKDCQKKLDEIETLSKKFSEFREIEPILEKLQIEVAYCDENLEYLKKKYDQQPDFVEDQKEAGNGEKDLPGKEAKLLASPDYITKDSIRREPTEMLRPEYQGMPMFDIIASILDSNLKELSYEDVARIAYDTNSEDEFERAKASIAAQLRVGASKQKWVKTGRGTFASKATTAFEDL